MVIVPVGDEHVGCVRVAAEIEGQQFITALRVNSGSAEQAGLVHDPDSPSPKVFIVIFKLCPFTHVLDTFNEMQKVQVQLPFVGSPKFCPGFVPATFALSKKKPGP
jgi:hypothetical protein